MFSNIILLFIDSISPISNKKNILITYTSGYGSTAEVATNIGKHLSEEGFLVSILSPADVENITQYDAIIVGSPIQYDRWMPEVRSFVIDNQEHLSKVPVAYFFCCLTFAIRIDSTEKKARQYADKLYDLSQCVKPISIGRFAGVLDLKKMSFLMHVFFKIFSMIIGVKEDDYRDWNEIRQWSKDVATKFRSEI